MLLAERLESGPVTHLDKLDKMRGEPVEVSRIVGVLHDRFKVLATLVYLVIPYESPLNVRLHSDGETLKLFLKCLRSKLSEPIPDSSAMVAIE